MYNYNSFQTDFLLVVVRDMVEAYPQLRVILMSATIDTTMFSEFFGNCPVMEIYGRSFPVQGEFFKLMWSFFIIWDASQYSTRQNFKQF